jgi:penicillin-binding protein 1A
MKKVYADQTLIQYRRGAFTRPANYVLDCGNVATDSSDTYTPPKISDDEGALF